MVGGVVAVVGAVAADVRGEKGVVVSTEQTGGVQWTLQCIACCYLSNVVFDPCSSRLWLVSHVTVLLPKFHSGVFTTPSPRVSTMEAV